MHVAEDHFLIEAMDSYLCMGASIGTSHSMEKASGKEFARKLVAVIGDSTFIHSGLAGLIDLMYNEGTDMALILDNRTTAMTSHQDHPGTGLTLKKGPTKKLDLATIARSLGVEVIRKVDPYDLKIVEDTIREELAREEPSVVIAERPCVLIEHEKKPRRINIITEQCKGCKKCLQLCCPEIYLAGDRVVINEALCNGCTLCVQVCPHEALKVEENYG